MSSDNTNFASLVRDQLIKTTVDKTDLIAIGVFNGTTNGDYITAAITGEDLKKSVVDSIVFPQVVPSSGRLEGTDYVYVAANGTDVQNASELTAAYVTAQGMSPSSTNRITIIAAPGNYNFSPNFIMSAPWVDLVSLDGNRSIVFNGTGTIQITANDVFVKGVDVGTLQFKIANSLPALRVENCSGGDDSFAGGGTASGVFTNCTGGYGSFGGNYGTASGTFTDCIGGNFSFGGGTASGVFTNCTGGYGSFGGNGTASGVFTNCKGGDDSFGMSGLASGTFTDCIGGNGSFAAGGTASGVFTNCTGGEFSFGMNGLASGTFTNCTGGYGSFAAGGTASGVFTNCTGGEGAFGGFGTLEGSLYYCRLISGAFETVSGLGVTRLCIDGNNVINNQG